MSLDLRTEYAQQMADEASELLQGLESLLYRYRRFLDSWEGTGNSVVDEVRQAAELFGER